MTEGAAEPPGRLPNFLVADQFGRERDEETYRGVPLIVVVGDRDGAAGAARWTSALRAEAGDASDVHVMPVADLCSVPRLLRRVIRRLLPRDPAHWCALDWEGQLGAPIRGAHGPLVAAVYGADGVLRAWTALRADTVSRSMVGKLVARAAAR